MECVSAAVRTGKAVSEIDAPLLIPGGLISRDKCMSPGKTRLLIFNTKLLEEEKGEMEGHFGSRVSRE